MICGCEVFVCLFVSVQSTSSEFKYTSDGWRGVTARQTGCVGLTVPVPFSQMEGGSVCLRVGGAVHLSEGKRPREKVQPNRTAEPRGCSDLSWHFVKPSGAGGASAHRQHPTSRWQERAALRPDAWRMWAPSLTASSGIISPQFDSITQTEEENKADSRRCRSSSLHGLNEIGLL